MPGIFQHREAQLDFSLGHGLRVCRGAGIRRKLECGCVEAPFVGAADFTDGLDRFRVEAFLADPNRLPLVLGIIGGHPGDIVAGIALSACLGGMGEDLRGKGIEFGRGWRLGRFGGLCPAEAPGAFGAGPAARAVSGDRGPRRPARDPRGAACAAAGFVELAQPACQLERSLAGQLVLGD